MTTNVFAQFKRLLPDQPLQVADVISVGSGVATVQLPGGASLVVRGQATVGTKVFVRGGLIEGPAPSLTVVTVEV
jgi:hypothetical protein